LLVGHRPLWVCSLLAPRQQTQKDSNAAHVIF
jgi:hypothetical protein